MKAPPRIVGVALALAGIALALWGLGVPLKAAFAQALLDRAWHRALAGEARPRAWPWADAHPIARLSFPGEGGGLVILDDASGASLAFAPGHVAGTAFPGDRGTSVIAAHRDTHFRVLRDLREGDRARLERPDGTSIGLIVTGRRVIDTAKPVTLVDTDTPLVVLTTCWPFDAVIPGGPMRYAVTLSPIER